MSCFLGIDTSNYTTSVALSDDKGKIILNRKIPLKVADGERGLRQSDAVFSHVRNLPLAFESLRGKKGICAVGVSAYPRDAEGSYMPCFLAGVAAAESVASVLNVPLFRFSHQRGHVRAALYSTGREDLLEKRFAAFHLSGGTTEILLSEEESITKVGGTLDINAGQAIDRVGVLLGIPFPCGPGLSDLAIRGKLTERPKPCVRGLDCNFSGVENKAVKMITDGCSGEDIARYTLEFVKSTIDKLCENLIGKYGDIEIIFAGGVSSNRDIAGYVSGKYRASFASPEFSSDNAAGTALLARDTFFKECDKVDR